LPTSTWNVSWHIYVSEISQMNSKCNKSTTFVFITQHPASLCFYSVNTLPSSAWTHFMLQNHRYHEKEKVNYLRKVCKEAPAPQFKATVHCCPGQTRGISQNTFHVAGLTSKNGARSYLN
jgi:hypothetical protein